MRRGWRIELTSFLLGTASGMATNLVSGLTAYRAIAAAITLAALLMASTRLSAMPARAPLVRYGMGVMLALALFAVIVAGLGPANLTPYMIFGAVGMTSAAVLIPSDPFDRMWILSGVAHIGLGVAGVSFGIAGFTTGGRLLGMTSVSAGVAVVVLGVTILTRGGLGVGKAVIGLGVAGVVVGVAIVALGGLLLGVGLVGAGVAGVVVGILSLTRGGLLVGMMVVGAGLAIIISGVIVTRGGLLLGMALVGFGLAVVSCGIAVLARTDSADRVKAWLAYLTREPGRSQNCEPQSGANAGRGSLDETLP